MTITSFKTIQKESTGMYREKGSRFLSFALPVKDEEEIKEIISDYKKQYHDSRHVCYAYMLGAERKDFRVNDDGEPSGTAGRPILGQINSCELTNVLVIVVRYFGGVLLGTGGLVTAYKEAAANALNEAEIIEETVDITADVYFEYPEVELVMSTLKELNADILIQDFMESCHIQFRVPIAHQEYITQKLDKFTELSFISLQNDSNS